MASIGPSTIASSFERLLILPGGGGDSTNLIPLTDGDAGTTFGLKLSTTDISVPATGKVYLDGGDSTYITESSDGIIDFYAHGKVVLKLNNSGETIISSNALRIGDEDNTSPAVIIQSHYEQADSNTTVHVISPGGNNYSGDTILLGRADDRDNTHVVLNSRVGVGTHEVYPTGPNYRLDVYDNQTGLSNYDYAMKIHHDGGTVYNAVLKMMCGEDGADGSISSNVNRIIRVDSGAGDKIAEFNHTNGTAAWSYFTASHAGKIPQADNVSGYAYGTLLDVKSLYYLTTKNGSNMQRGIMYNMEKTSSAYSRAVLGAYSAKKMPDVDDIDANGETLSADVYNEHEVYILGDGHILCNNEKGNISIGDGITSSSTAGIGMKADKTCMIVGIAQEDVTFSGSETKLVAVQYGIRQFTPWAD